MGGAFSKTSWMQNPNAAGAPGGGGYLGLESWGADQGLGWAGKANKQLGREMQSGDYTGIAQSQLNPIIAMGEAARRGMEREAQLGGNALWAGDQPALRMAIGNEARRRLAEGTQMQLGNAIPQLWGQATQGYQGALNASRQAQLGALQSGLQGRLQSGQYQTKPGWLTNMMGVMGGLGGMMAGIPGMAGLGRSSPAGNMVTPDMFGGFIGS